MTEQTQFYQIQGVQDATHQHFSLSYRSPLPYYDSILSTRPAELESRLAELKRNPNLCALSIHAVKPGEHIAPDVTLCVHPRPRHLARVMEEER